MKYPELLEEAKADLKEFILEKSLTSKYLQVSYVEVKNPFEIYMNENEGFEDFERLHKAFEFFINESGFFSWENHDEMHNNTLIHLSDYAQFVYDGEDCTYAADYYFEYQGIKYTLDIERVASDGIDGDFKGSNFVFCNIFEFVETFNRFDKKTNLIFIYDKVLHKFIKLMYVAKHKYENSDIKILRVLNANGVEKVQRRILNNI